MLVTAAPCSIGRRRAGGKYPNGIRPRSTAALSLAGYLLEIQRKPKCLHRSTAGLICGLPVKPFCVKRVDHRDPTGRNQRRPVMSEKTQKFEKELDRLIRKGDSLNNAILLDCYSDEYVKMLADTLNEAEVEDHLKSLPKFKEEYQSWYSEALALVKQVLPDRHTDFSSFYEYPRARKEITNSNYMIKDYLKGISVTRQSGLATTILVDGKAAIPAFEQQLQIVKAAKSTLSSSLLDLKLIIQADLFDSEIDGARSLVKAGYLRAAGAICGVVIEKHLKQVCDTHGILIRKKRLTISDFESSSTRQGTCVSSAVALCATSSGPTKHLRPREGKRTTKR